MYGTDPGFSQREMDLRVDEWRREAEAIRLQAQAGAGGQEWLSRLQHRLLCRVSYALLVVGEWQEQHRVLRSLPVYEQGRRLSTQHCV
jgi:hypothetical protein